MLKKVLLAFALALIILGIVIQVQPNTYAVDRSISVNAPPERIYAILTDFHNFPDWSPWQKLDPAMKTTYSGPPTGTGAMYSWVGNKEAGEGSMTITDVVPNEKVGMHLQFLKPFPSESEVLFTIHPEGAGSHVVWSMSGQNNFIMKGMSLFASMDKMIGPDFERGLSQLKSKAESPKL